MSDVKMPGSARFPVTGIGTRASGLAVASERLFRLQQHTAARIAAAEYGD